MIYDDIQFIKKYDEAFGIRYESAKNHYIDAPVQTLSELRELLSSICDRIIDEYQIALTKDVRNSVSPKLDENIAAISSANVFRPDIINNLHEVRRACNKGVHRKEKQLSFDECSDLAVKTLKIFCETVNDISLGMGLEVLEYTFSKTIISPLKDLSYKAIFHDDTDAKFELGMALVEKYDDYRIANKSNSMANKRALKRAIDFVEEAALEQHPEAMYEYGEIRLKGIQRDKSTRDGLNYIYNSASHGFTNAQTYYARLIFESNDPDIKKEINQNDIEDAVAFVKDAAEKENGMARYVLSKLYGSGKHIEKNKDKALSLLSLAAEGGYSEAMYDIAMHKIKLKGPQALGEELDTEVMEYLTIATQKGHKKARYQHLTLCKKYGGEFEFVCKLYDQHVDSHPEDHEVCLEFAEYLYQEKGNIHKYTEKALGLLCLLATDNTLPPRIRKKINRLSPVWLETLFYLVGASKSETKKDRFQQFGFNFNPDGVPYENADNVREEFNVNPMSYPDLFYTVPKTKRKIRTVTETKLVTAAKKTGRNEPCPCGSEKKFKVCCGKP